MGKTGIQKDKEDREVKIYLTRCNDCGRDVRLSSDWEVTSEKIEELQKRMLCSDCLKRKLEPKK